MGPAADEAVRPLQDGIRTRPPRLAQQATAVVPDVDRRLTGRRSEGQPGLPWADLDRPVARSAGERTEGQREVKGSVDVDGSGGHVGQIPQGFDLVTSCAEIPGQDRIVLRYP